ncbi:polysaccharide pyruvyl transferase family protein [Naasia lichenicola]|uniref:Polysaccharide pyruvyl transferase family protein n=1 Tax=Naasia lichenicola TaxID=2565933 RepID=A0A4S4FL10_9MICO|nr:polysaccharide pyruvyl transferase family protein [Naasia lichenicola]THG31080.1 polysaccharide pyruvyl transferase family protein [Naasia lichenicola]
MRVVVIGDVGVLDGMVHIGDEAMFEELVTQLRARGASVVGISSAPSETAERYGIDAIPRIGWPAPHDRVASDDRRARVLRAAHGDPSGLAADDPALAVIAAVREADGVAIAGGGNIASTWPVHIHERTTLGAIAAALGVPLVVSGQTIGPALVASDAERVRELLGSARRVGLREAASFALCARLGVPAELLHQTTDDASFLGIDDPRLAADDPTAPGCLVSLSGYLGDAPEEAALSAIAALLDAVHLATGLEITFLPHFGPLGRSLGGHLDGDVEGGQPLRGDDRIHSAVRARMTTGQGRAIPATDSRTAAALARSAQLVVTSRYHPAVFAAAAATPILGIPVDDYTRVKLTGALGNLGQACVVPLAELLAARSEGRMDEVVDRVWRTRLELAERTAPAIDAARQASTAWWDAIAADFARRDVGNG